MQGAAFATILIPTFNQEAFLPAALDSILAQSDGDWEAIIINDGSTDSTAEIAESYARKDARFRCIHKENGGVASALNEGLRFARGQWIHWLSSDDLFEPKKLAINRQWIDAHPQTKFFFSYFTLLVDKTGVQEKRGLWGPLPESEHQVITLLYRNYISGISICVNRAAWHEIGYFDVSLRYAQDYDTWLRLLQKFQGKFIPEWTVVNRNHANQGSETFPDACYFDTSKAAIRFINQHTFFELFPFTSKNDHVAVTMAVEKALEIASDRTAFIYCLGPHTGLIERICEWVFSPDCAIDALRDRVKAKVREIALAEGLDNWSWMWRKLALVLEANDGLDTYIPVDHRKVAVEELLQREAMTPGSGRVLKDYLDKFEQDYIYQLPSQDVVHHIVVLLLKESSELERLQPSLQELAKQGLRVLCLLDGRSTANAYWHREEWGDAIYLDVSNQHLLPLLAEVELAVAFPGVTLPVWLAASMRKALSSSEDVASLEQLVSEQFSSDATQQVLVVFIERVLRGGGAERVILDVACNLDKRRYRPIILTMFDEHLPVPELPPHVEAVNIRRNISLPQASIPVNCGGSIKVVSTQRRIFMRLHEVYAKVLPGSIRSRLKLKQRALVLLHSVRRASCLIRRAKSRIRTPSAEHTVSCSHHVFELDYLNSMAHYGPIIDRLCAMIPEFPSDFVCIPAMEEATVTTWLAQARGSFPYLASLHTVESSCLPQLYPASARYQVEKWLLSVACNDAKAVIFPSQGCCDDMINKFHVNGTNIQKIWNPISCSTVRRMSMKLDVFAHQWRENASGFRLVHVGRIDTQKNHDLLLDVCALLQHRGRNISLAIVGDGWDRPRLERHVEERGLKQLVRFVGEQQNPFPWMAAADALLLTSLFEAFALVLVEAMACGTPVISVDCPTGPAEVLGSGEYGILVQSHNAVLLADAVELLMDDADLITHYKRQGLVRAADFDISKIIPQWQMLIDRVAKVN